MAKKDGIVPHAHRTRGVQADARLALLGGAAAALLAVAANEHGHLVDPGKRHQGVSSCFSEKTTNGRRDGSHLLSLHLDTDKIASEAEDLVPDLRGDQLTILRQGDPLTTPHQGDPLTTPLQHRICGAGVQGGDRALGT